jgi:ureidoacrylate peracid hydrolase
VSTLSDVFNEPSALILWDINKVNIAEKAGGNEMADGVRTLLCGTRPLAIPTIWSLHRFLPAAYESTVWREQYARRGVALPTSAKDGEFADDPGPVDGELVLHKSRTSFFVGTLLADVLANLSVRVIVLAGASTDTGIAGTARDALSRGITTVLATDALAANSTAVHESALKELSAFAHLANCVEIVAAWNASHAG